MSDIDSLEYSVKFPQVPICSSSSSTADTRELLPRSQSSNGNGSEQDYVFVDDECSNVDGEDSGVATGSERTATTKDTSKVPVIVLFGWAGCKDKYLAKYSQIYEDQGLITLRYITPNKYLFWKYYEMISIGEKLVRLLIDLNFDAHPIIVHVFSNGGAAAYQHFSKALEKSPKQLQIRGTIFDSTPGRRRVVTLFKAVSAIFGGNVVYNYSISILITFFVTVMWMFEYFCDLVSPKKVGASDIIQYLKLEKNRWPQLCIYSKTDELIPYYDIENFMEARRKMGIDMTALKFEDSPHVKHYIYNKDSYVTTVRSFVNKCLGNGN